MDILILLLLVVLLFYALYRFVGVLRRYNGAEWGHPAVNLVDGLIRWSCRHYHRMEQSHLPIPDKGAAIVVANHISGLDPLLLIAASSRPLRFLIAREEYDRFGLTWLFKLAGCIPVERESRPERAFREAIKVLRSGEVVALFPHGGIQMKSEPPRQIKKGAIRLAQISGCPIYPVRLDGIAAKGFTLLALVIPSRAKMRFCEPVMCDPEYDPLYLQQVSDCINSAIKPWRH